MKNNTTKPKPPIIKKDKDNPEPTEVIAKAIIEVAEAARKLNGSKLKRRAVVLLLKDMTGNSVSNRDIEMVLDCAAELDKRYIKP